MGKCIVGIFSARAFEKSAASVFAAIACGIGLMVITGWVLDVQALKAVVAGFPAMKLNTAITIVSLGAATLLSRFYRRASTLFQMISVLLASATLAEWMFGVDLGIDQAFVSDPGRNPPGRMSALTAVILLLLGGALGVRTHFHAWQRTWQGITLTGLFLSSFAFFGYLFGAGGLASLYAYTTMALPTTTALLLLGLSLLFEFPDRGFMAAFHGSGIAARLARRVLPATIFVLALLGYITRRGSQAGIFDASFDIALLVTFASAIFTWLIWRDAVALGSADANYHANLEKLNRELERKVQDRTKALAQSERRYRAIIESAYDSIFVLDSNGLIEIVNERAALKFGYSPEELLGRPVEVILPQKLWDRHADQRKTFMRDPEALATGARLDLRARKKDGGEFPVDVSLSPMAAQDGIHVTAIVRDVTERKRHEDQQAFLAALFTALDETTDYESRIRRMMNALIPKIADQCVVRIEENGRLELKGAATADLPNAALLKDQAEKDLSSGSIYSSAGVMKALKPLLIEDVRTEITVNDPTLRAIAEALGIVSHIVVPLIVGGRAIGTLSLSMSVSGRKFSTADFEFISIAANRLAVSLENARLYEEARRATKEREAILSMVSHDLKNPLASIDLTARKLDESGAQPLRDLAARLRSSSAQMLRLISDLLDFSRIDGGGMAVVKATADVTLILRQALESLAEKAAAKGLELSVQSGGQLYVLGDANRIVQVLWNLVGNAIKFTPARGRISISVEQDGGFVKFTVTDSGPGIGREELAHVFDRFWQAQKTAALGTGLGLAISKGIVDAHGGRIWAESEPGKGARFHFTIPAADRVETAAKIPLGLHVLAVDDSEDNLSLIKAMLEDSGVRVTEAHSMTEALQRLAAEMPDVLITDIEMPGGSGFDLLDKIRGKLPVAALTGHDTESDLKKIRDAGFDTCVTKPVSREKLISSIGRLVSAQLQPPL